MLYEVITMIRVGNQKGLEDYAKLRLVAFSIFLLTVLLEIIFALTFLVLHEQLPKLFLDLKDVENLEKNLEVVTLASKLLLIA